MKITKVSWNEFKEKVYAFSNINYRRMIFRGQADVKWDLKTSFHRENEKVSNKYTFLDYIEYLKQYSYRYSEYLTQKEGIYENDYDVLQYLSFLQQHGCPTPLLDWTESPFIAVYFAFKDSYNLNFDHGDVRIYCFDIWLWRDRWAQSFQLDIEHDHLSIFYANSKGNPRLIQQQGLYTISNTANIIQYLDSKGQQAKQLRSLEVEDEYIHAYDIPVTERNNAIKELHLMGVSEMSLFPGPDGTCRYLKQDLFREN